MLHSFLRHNEWFDGDIIVLHDTLSETDQEKLRGISGKIKVSRISPEMARATNQLLEKRPEMAPVVSSFYKGDFLKFDTYDKVIFSDCDILYQGSIQNLLGKPDALMACGDGAYYHDRRRSISDYTLITDTDQPYLQKTFSAGFVILGFELLGTASFDTFLTLMGQYSQNCFTSGNTDQAILNVMFDGMLTRLDCRFNYHLLHKDIIMATTGVTFDDSIVLHYGGHAKPWNPVDSLAAISTDGALKEIFDLWRLSYGEYIACHRAQ